MKSHFITLILSGLLLSAFGAPLFGQEEDSTVNGNNEEGDVSRVGLGTPLGAVGGTVLVPIVFVPTAGTSIQELKLTVTYRSTYLEFERVNSPYSPGSGRYEVELEKKEISGRGLTESTTLVVKATTRSDQPDEAGLPSGRLANLVFRISEHSDRHTVHLIPTVEAVEAGSGRQLRPDEFEALEGSVRVEEKVTDFVGICFFFAH